MNATTMAVMANMAYGAQNNPQGRYLSAEGAQGVVVHTKRNIVVSLRGTDEIQDWIDNLNLQQSKAYGGKVHTGFAMQMYGISHQLFDAVMTGYADQKIWVTGHSLGGALAVLAGYLLQGSGFKPSVYTFGAPRVFDRVAAAAYTVPTVRYVNCADIVPRLPASTPWGSYRHVGELMYLRGGIPFFNMVKSLLRGPAYMTAKMLLDHRLSEYIRKIKELDNDDA